MLKKTVKRIVRKWTRHMQLVYSRLEDSWPYVPLQDYANAKKLILFWKLDPYAQQNYASLFNVYNLAWSVEKDKRQGCFVECGVWRGGCAALMAMVAKEAGSGRKTWLFDSFEGMPEATVKDVGDDARVMARGRMEGRLTPVGTNIASINEVKALLFQKLHLDARNVVVAEGWFQDTVPAVRNRMGPIAILRIDADWYESTKICLEYLYDSVVEGGYVIIDDYGWFPGCKKAVDEFIETRKLKVDLEKVDYSPVYFQKCSVASTRESWRSAAQKRAT